MNFDEVSEDVYEMIKLALMDLFSQKIEFY
jgi:hypothetical protein